MLIWFHNHTCDLGVIDGYVISSSKTYWIQNNKQLLQFIKKKENKCTSPRADSSVHWTFVLRPCCPHLAWQGSEEGTDRLLLLYRVLKVEGGYGGGGSLYFYDALFVSCQLPKILLHGDSHHTSASSLHQPFPSVKVLGKPRKPAPRSSSRGAGLRGGGDAHLLVGDLQQLQHHGVGAHVPEQALLLLSALPHGRTLLNTEFAESDQNLAGRKDQSFLSTHISVLRI